MLDQQKPASGAWQSAITTLLEVQPPFGPCFGYVVDGEMVFELEGEPARVVKAGEAFWEPGGDVIHYQNGNNRDDIPVRFTVTMLGEPGKPMLTLVDPEELARRRNRRVRGTGPAE
jgi:hypothetical protein